VDIHEPPEALHFGLDLNEAASAEATTFVKRMRRLNGQSAVDAAAPVRVPYRSPERRVVDAAALANAMAAKFPAEGWTSAEFSFEMVQGVGLISFINSGEPVP
jgi:hypothetical protein